MALTKCRLHPRYMGAGQPDPQCGACLNIYRRLRKFKDFGISAEELAQSAANPIGRPVRLNQVTLALKKGKDYAQIMCFGDVHLGYPQCRLESAREYLDWAIKHGVYILLMGDLVECGTTRSVGDSIYRQKLNPQEQKDAMIEILRPAAEAELIIGIHSGNHENRIFKDSGIDITKDIARELELRYLRYACWSLLAVGNQKYSMYSQHGSSGATNKQSKISALAKQSGWIHADVLAMGHVHEVSSGIIDFQRVDTRRRKIVREKCLCVLTGSYIDWDDSYAQEKSLPINRVGSPTIKLMSGRHDVHVSI